MENTHLSARDEQARRLAETLRRQLGPKLCGLMEAPDVVELMLNANGQVWVDRIGHGMSSIGSMPGPTAESLIATVAHCHAREPYTRMRTAAGASLQWRTVRGRHCARRVSWSCVHHPTQGVRGVHVG